MKDAIAVTRLEKLHPKVRATFKAFIEECEGTLGITLRITQGLRTVAEQDALYAQGRTAPGKIVTNAKGGTSYHNYGLAIDVVRMSLKEPDWNYDLAPVAAIATKHGIEWGGNFENLVDKPHFQITLGQTWQQLAGALKSNQIDEHGYVLV